MVTMPPVRPSADEPTGRHRRRAWVISGVLHGLVLAWWASLPEPERSFGPSAPRWAAVELVDPIVTQPVEPPAPSPESSPEEPAEPETTEPDQTDEPDEPDQTSRPSSPPGRSRSRSQTQRTPAESPASAPSETEATETEPGGLALLGLRGSSRVDSTRTTVRPSLPPPRVDGGQVIRQVGGARGGLSSGSRDGKPSSLVEAGFRRTRGGKMVYADRQSGFKATLLPDGRLKFRTTVTPSSMPGMTEVIRAAQGQELFQQQKKKLLDATFELRLQMAVEFARGHLDRRLKSLYRELIDQWSDDSSSEARRREALFQRWDECEEGLPGMLRGFEGAQGSEVDELRRSAGADARETIERFIRRHLPQGSAQAFTAEELRRFDARRQSKARFRPYR